MPQYDAIDPTYLRDAIDLIKYGLEYITKAEVRAYPMLPQFDREAVPETFWIVAPVGEESIDEDTEGNTQIWSVASMFLQKVNLDQYDPSVYEEGFILYPMIKNYFQAHKSLKFNDDHVTPKWLRVGQVTVRVGSINAGGQPGLAIIHRLPFDVPIEQRY